MLNIPHPHIKSREIMMQVEDCDKWILDEGVRYMENFNGSHDTMLEIGAHIGCSSLYFAAEKGFKWILAIEAFSENFNKLVMNIYNNQLQNIITPMWAAVALKTGEIRPIFWSGSMSNHGQYSSFFRTDLHINAGFTQTISFEHVLSLFDTIDVLKIDIEGGEYEIFSPRDSLKDALKRVKFMELETHTPAPGFFADDEFAQYGYPHQETANVILKSFLKDCGFDFDFRGETAGGMQGYNRNF
ncbi:unnamed protein product, partial [marine sediment metagenome]